MAAEAATPAVAGRPPLMERNSGGPRGQRWVVVTGLVPIDKQSLAFSEFKNSVCYDANTDTPRYAGYTVARVEVLSPAEAEKPDWSKAVSILSGAAVQEARTRWGAQERQEVVAPAFIASKLAFPLGPMTNRDWGASAAHLPQIPLQSSEKSLTTPRPADLTPKPDAPPKTDEFGNEIVAAPVAPTTGRDETAKTPPYLLFRFFDYNVEPGKRYVYRVQLALYNPNFGLKPNLLKDPKLTEKRYSVTDWSHASAAIFVPRDTRILAISVKPGHARTEPQAHVLLVKWLEEKGIEVSKEYSLFRGQVANFTDKTTVTPPVRAPARGTPDRPLARGTPARPPARGTPARPPARPEARITEPTVAAAPETSITVEYFSDAIALDFRGGEYLRGRKTRSIKLIAPAEILVVDADGTLVLHNELDEEAAHLKLTAHEVEVKPQSGVLHGGALRNILGP